MLHTLAHYLLIFRLLRHITITQIICKIHRYPRSIISDCDPSFINNFYQTLFQLNGTKLMMSTTYRPETDGQIEVLNRYLQQ